jgi:thymidylate synthase
MNKLDKQYTDLLQDILDNGTRKMDRTRTGTISVFGRQIRHKMSEGFPLLTTKKMAWKTMVTELLWFLRGDTNIKFLVDNNCHIWDGDCHQSYLKNWKPQPAVETQSYLIEQEYVNDRPLPKDMFIHCIKTDDEFAKKWGELGPIYGKQWRAWGGYEKVPNGWTHGAVSSYREVPKHDQIANLINDLKTDPDSRRLMVNAWNPTDLPNQVLPPCHYGFQVYTRELSLEERREIFIKQINGLHFQIFSLEGEEGIHREYDKQNVPRRAISLMYNARSQDVPLGTPFNISSYALLLEIIAKMVNMVPDELIANMGDCHIYLNQIDGVKEQIGRELSETERYRIFEDRGYEFRMVKDWSKEEQYDKAGIPKRTREPYPLPTLKHMKTDEFYKSLSSDLSLLTHLDNTDFVVENYQSHPTIKMPLSN